MKILIVEDEKSLAKAVEKLFKKNGYNTDLVHDGRDAVYYASQTSYDAIVLDIMLPKLDGYEVLKTLRDKRNFTPVLLLTAKSELNDKITGFNIGADDYLTKPFESEELLVRVKAISRRKQVYISDEQVFLDLSIDKSNYTFSSGSESIKVNAKEFLIMEMFIQNKNQILSKEKLIENVWGYDYDGEYNQVEVYISFIRKKLKAIGSKVKIKVNRGIGYSIGEDFD